MVISHEATTVTDEQTTETNPVVPNLSTAVAGELQVLGICITAGGAATAPTVTIPTGWTEISTNQSQGGASAIRLVMMYRFWQSGDPTTLSITTSAVAGFTSVCNTYSGVNTSNPIDVEETDYNTGTDADPVSRAVTTVTTDTMVMRMYCKDDDLDTIPINPSGTTDRGSVSNGLPGNGSTFGVAELAQVAIGTTGAATWDGTDADDWLAGTFVLQETQVSYEIVGDVRDCGLTGVGPARCLLLKHDNAAIGSRIYTKHQAEVNSDGAGIYTFADVGDDDSQYVVIAVRDGPPIERGVTDDDLTPTEE